MMRVRGIAFRLSMAILASSGAIFAAIFVSNYVLSRRALERNIDHNARSVALASAYKIEAVIRSVEKVPRSLAAALEHSSVTPAEMRQILRAAVDDNPEIYGATIAFEPWAYSSGRELYAPFYFRSAGTAATTPRERLDRYTHLDWYQIARELRRPVWSEPYFDEGGGDTLMATFSVPFFRTVNGLRELRGIVTADISLQWLQELVSSIKVAQSGYGFVLSKNGTFVTHPLSHLVMNETVFSVAEEQADSTLRRIGRDMIGGKSDIVQVRSLSNRTRSWMAYTPVASNGWSLGVLFPQRELMADILALNRIVLGLGAAGFVILLLVTVGIAGSITRPIRLLAATTAEIARGNFEFTASPMSSDDEVGQLSRSFVMMRDSLRKYIADLTQTTAAKERIESELKIAHAIQTSMLPRIFPPFPDKKEFDLFAMIQPAREVGGDFYDFFFVDDRHLCFCIGDVSGKGVPASLFMAVTRTLIKTKSTSGLSPDTVLSHVNNDLCIDNESCMFATLFFGVLDTSNGLLEYANAGHNPPLIGRSGGSFRFLEMPQGMALGAVENAPFGKKSITMTPGDALLLYTDGITEALDAHQQFYTAERLASTIDGVQFDAAQQLLNLVYSWIKEFTQGEPQSDDITIETLVFRGERGRQTPNCRGPEV